MDRSRALSLKFCPIPFSPRPLIRPALLAKLKLMRKFSPRTSLTNPCRLHSQTTGNAGSSVDASCDKLLQVVLVSPQIPGNTGCIARTCAASSVGLHLVENRYVVVKVHGSWNEFREYFKQQKGEKRLLAFTKRGTNIHSDFSYRRGDWLVFGSETCGLPPETLIDCNSEGLGGGTIRIPMVDTYVRCLNLSVSVGISLYEAARQLNYEQLQFPSESANESQSLFIKQDIFG